MSLLLFLVFGLVVGLIARAVMPGKQSMSWVMTTLLGVAGSLVGGFLSSLIFHHGILELRSTGLIGSVLGAVIVLALVGVVQRRRFA